MSNILDHSHFKNPEIYGRRNIIPGTEKTKGREFIYFLDTKKFSSPKDNRRKSFNKQYNAINDALPEPLNAKHGAINEEGCRIILPNGDLFHALLVHGDPEGWIKDIEHAARTLEIPTAKIKNNKFVISDGRSFDLKDCKVEFDTA